MDEKLRQLGREAAGGDVEKGAKLLKERMRSGELNEGQINLAAFLQDERAKKIVTKNPEWIDWGHKPDRSKVFWALIKFNPKTKDEAVVRASMGPAKASQELLEKNVESIQSEEEPLDMTAPSRAVEVLEEWVVSPPEELSKETSEQFDNLISALTTIKSARNRRLSSQNILTPDDSMLCAANTLAKLLMYVQNVYLKSSSYKSTKTRNLIISIAYDSINVQRGQSFLNSLQKEFIPWFLGENDPIMKRVEARKNKSNAE